MARSLSVAGRLRLRSRYLPGRRGAASGGHWRWRVGAAAVVLSLLAPGCTPVSPARSAPTTVPTGVTVTTAATAAMTTTSATSPSSLLATAGASFSATTASPAPADTTVIEQGYNILLDHYVDPVRPSTILTGALTGLQQRLRDQGSTDAVVGPPAFTDDRAADWQRFVAIYSAAVQRYGRSGEATQYQYAALDGMAGSLQDCHTHFSDPQAWAETTSELTTGNQDFGGIGVVTGPTAGHNFLVVRLVPQGPAAKAGVRAGDIILTVDGHDMDEMTAQDLATLVRGPIGSAVRLTVLRPGESQPVPVTVIRGDVQVPNYESSVLTGNIGYVRFTAFSSDYTVPYALRASLTAFDQANTVGTIIDLRENLGGNPSVLGTALSLFLPDGTIFEFTTGRDMPEQAAQVHAADLLAHPTVKGPLVVLVDQGTGSAGEIFAAALQEYGKAELVGTATAGCVATGTRYMLSDGSGLSVTSQKVISGRDRRELNHVGVTPDVMVQLTPETLSAGHDAQLERALQVIHAAGTPTP